MTDTTTMTESQSLLITTAELAKLLSVNEKTIRRWNHQGVLPCDPVPSGPRGTHMWPRQPILDWVAAACPPREASARIGA